MRGPRQARAASRRRQAASGSRPRRLQAASRRPRQAASRRRLQAASRRPRQAASRRRLQAASRRRRRAVTLIEPRRPHPSHLKPTRMCTKPRMRRRYRVVEDSASRSCALSSPLPVSAGRVSLRRRVPRGMHAQPTPVAPRPAHTRLTRAAAGRARRALRRRARPCRPFLAIRRSHAGRGECSRRISAPCRDRRRPNAAARRRVCHVVRMSTCILTPYT